MTGAFGPTKRDKSNDRSGRVVGGNCYPSLVGNADDNEGTVQIFPLKLKYNTLALRILLLSFSWVTEWNDVTLSHAPATVDSSLLGHRSSQVENQSQGGSQSRD